MCDVVALKLKMDNLRDVILEIVRESNPYEDISLSTDLVEGEILDSLTLVYIVMTIEEKFNIVIDEKLVDPENFKDVIKISELVNKISEESEYNGGLSE